MNPAEQFHRSPDVNPITGRSITINGPCYIKLTREYGLPNSENLKMFDRYKETYNNALNIEYPPHSQLQYQIIRLSMFSDGLSIKELMGDYYISYMTLDRLSVTPQHSILKAHVINGDLAYSHEIDWKRELEKIKKYMRDIDMMTTLVKAKIILVREAIEMNRCHTVDVKHID
ncbi:Hypothetical protein POVR1_LOCUS600 [uncultured virus]|nr:Hypothetical protein POVR1_LOCUS600 [uncultured virus]